MAVRRIAKPRAIISIAAAGVVGLGLALGFAKGSIAQFQPLPPVNWTGSNATPAFRTLKAPPVTPVTAFGIQGGSATSTNGLCRDHPTFTQICVSGVTPHSDEFLELSRALRGDPDLIYEFVRNGVETDFQFGLTKGNEGVIVDRSGTAFDQAKLLVDLLRHAGFTARYRFGDITPTPAQVEEWTGFSDARAVCEFFAGGGIPVSINGSTTTCDQTGAVTSASIAHVWVEAEIQGQTVQLDPAFKVYVHHAGLDVRALSGMTAGTPLSTAIQGVSRTDGGATTQSYDQSALAVYLSARAEALRAAIRSPANRGKSVQEIVGGRAIVDAVRPAGGWRATSLPHVGIVRATWSGGVPDAYRTTLNIQFAPYYAPQTPVTANVFADEVYARPIRLSSQGIGYADGGGVGVTNPVNPCQPRQPCAENVSVTMNRPFAAQSSAYGDATIQRPIKSLDGAALVLGFGVTGEAKAQRWSSMYAEFTDPYGTIIGTAARPILGASWLGQFSAAAELQAELAESRVTHLHTLGVIYNIYTDGYDARTDHTNVIDLETAVAVTSREGSATKRRALIHALAATAATLEGSVTAGNFDDSASTARRLSWANRPSDGDTPAKFYAIAAGGAAPAATAFETYFPGGGDIQTFRNALGAYLGKGFAITTASNVLLGPGEQYGTHLEDGRSYAAPSTERGGAFVATKYDANGDPTEIAHVVTNHYVAAKGGGAPAPLNPAGLVRDDFDDRSGIAGVNLRTGTVGYSTPVLNSVGQGEFPYKLEERLELRGGGFDIYNVAGRSQPQAPTNGLVSNFDGGMSLGSSTAEAMGRTQADAAAGTIVAFIALQDIYGAAANADRDVAGILAADWWGRNLVFNLVTVKQGGSNTDYVFAGWEGGHRVFRSKDGGKAHLIGEGRTILTAGAFDPSEYDVFDLSYTQVEVVDRNGVKRLYEPTPGGAWVPSLTQRLKSWQFPSGAVVNVQYVLPSQPSIQWGHPVSVTSNTGLSLTLNTHPRVAPQDWGAIPSQITNWNCHTHMPAAGGVFSITDAAGRVHRLKVKPGADLKCVIDTVFSPSAAPTAVVNYIYGRFNRVTEVRDAVSMENAAARGSHQFFIVDGFRGQRQDTLGGRYTVETGSAGRTERHIDEEGRVSTAFFDGEQRVIRRVNAFGAVTEFKYDDRDNIAEVKRSPIAGCGVSAHWCQTSIVTATYNAWNKPVTITLPATVEGQVPHTWSFDYDGQGRQIAQTSPQVLDGRTGAWSTAVSRTGYDAYGRVNWTQDPTGVETRTEYGGHGQSAWCLTRQHAADQNASLRQTVQFTCDSVGNVLTTTDPRGNVTTTTWDALRRKQAEEGPASTGITTQWTYDTEGNVLTESRWDATAGAWRTTTMTYSATGKPLTVTDPSGDVSRTCYDAMDRAIVAVDATGRATQTEYNAAGQVRFVKRWYTASTSDPTCALTQARPAHLSTNVWREIRYNAGGLQVAELDGNGNQTSLIYDGLGRLMDTVYADGKSVRTYRNERDQVWLTVKRDGSYVQAWFDPAGRVDWVREYTDPNAWPIGRHTRTSYDLAGRPTRTDVSTQTASTYEAAQERDIRTYQYDGAGRVIWDVVRPNDATMGGASLALYYDYDKANNRTMIVWPDGYKALYGFDAANRADRVEFGPASNPSQHAADIAVDSLSRRTGVSRSSGANSTYGYEPDGDLASLNHGWGTGVGTPSGTFGYQHDATGRITRTTVSRPDLEWMPTLAEAASYGAPTNLNQMTSANGVALTWDDNGNLLKQGTTDYDWTYGNRLWRVRKPGSTTEYGYDAQDRRTLVVENGVTTRTLWSGQDEVGQYDAAGAVLRRFIPDGSGTMDARLAVVEASGTVTWFHTDHQGSVIATSNAAGQPIQFANYSPHGKFGTDQNGNTYTAPPSGSPFGYTGRQWDAAAGLYNYRARYYDPALGVFLSMDPIGSKDDPNLYMYVGLDPVNHFDPNGQETRTVGSNWVLYPRDPRLPQGIQVPRPASGITYTAGVSTRYGPPDTIVPGRGNDHAYTYETNIGQVSLSEARAGVRANPVTPEGSNNAATVGGTLNGAGAPIGWGSDVMTYSRNGGTAVVNVTVTGMHVFEYGWVMTYAAQNADGTVSLITYGEGNAAVQAEWFEKLTAGIIESYVEDSWERRAEGVRRCAVVSDCSH